MFNDNGGKYIGSKKLMVHENINVKIINVKLKTDKNVKVKS